MKKILSVLAVLSVLVLTTGVTVTEDAKIEKQGVITVKKVMSDPSDLTRP